MIVLICEYDAFNFRQFRFLSFKSSQISDFIKIKKLS
jgi:hypothetical protein